MRNIAKPDGYQTVMPYLTIKNAEDFLSFTKTLFGAKERMKHMRDESQVMHAEIEIGDAVIMVADSTDQHKPCTAGLFIYVDDADEVFRKSLSLGANSIMEPSDQEYGRSGGIRDPFGNVWWITSVR